jgi:ATP-dependent DNA ligase
MRGLVDGAALPIAAAGTVKRSPRDRTTSPPTTLPQITPIRLLERAAPFDDPNCLFELKYDGFRAVAERPHVRYRLARIDRHHGRGAGRVWAEQTA